MKNLKLLFPVSYMAKNVKDLIISILLYIALGVIAGLLCWVLGIIPLIGGFLAWLVGVIAGLYVLIGIILAVLVFLKIVK